MNKLMIVVCVAMVGLVPTAQADIIDGGLTWGGWTSVGQSNQLGVYGSGSATDVYNVYSKVFPFNNDSRSGSPSPVGGGPTGGTTGFGTGAFSTGAFANGHTIFGIGVDRVSGAVLTGFTPTVRFDLDSDSFKAATSVGGGDGRTSFTFWSETGDFTTQFEGANSWRGSTLTMQVGTGTSNGGPNNQQMLVGGFGSGVSYDFAFRAFAQNNSYQMLFDLTAMQSLYGVANPFGTNASFTGIGSVGNSVRISLNGLGSNNVVFDAPTVPAAVPDGGATFALLGGALLGFAGLRRKFRV